MTPNQGKKVRLGRKLQRLPKEGKVRNFDDLVQLKRKKEKQKAKENKHKGKGAKK